MNIEKLMPLMPGDADSAVIITQHNRKYFTGFESSDGFLVVTRKSATFITDSRYIEAASAAVTGCEAVLAKNEPEQIREILDRDGCRSAAFEASGVTLADFHRFESSSYFEGIRLIGDSSLDDAITRIRRVKSEGELDRIIRAQRIAEEGLDHILGFIKPGLTEKQVQLELDYYMLSHGAEALSFETIAVSGANSSKPHGVPGEKVIENGDFLTLDFGAVYEGYHSDMTRTVAVGSATAEMRKVYSVVLEAQLAGLAALRPGLPCAEGDKAARDVIEAAGYGKYFGHSTGHGVGIEIHEEPRLSPKSKQTLEPGDVVTVEPGIYIPGSFGVRIEDMAYITADGSRDITLSPKELTVL